MRRCSAQSSLGRVKLVNLGLSRDENTTEANCLSPVTAHEREHNDDELSINTRTMDDAVNATINEPLDVVKLSLGE